MLHGRRQLVLLRRMVNSYNERNPFDYLLQIRYQLLDKKGNLAL